MKLRLQYFGYLMGRVDSQEKTLILGKIKGKRRREWQKIRWLNIITDSMDLNLNITWETVRTGHPGVLLSMGLQRDMT